MDPESRLAEVGLLDAEIGTLRADNRSLRAVNKVLDQDKKAMEIEIEKLQSELEELRKENMKARPMILLYDALTILSPIEERWKVQELMHKCMSTDNSWTIHGRQLTYTIDVGFTNRWGASPTEDMVQILSERK